MSLVYSPQGTQLFHQLALKLGSLIRVQLFQQDEIADDPLVECSRHHRGGCIRDGYSILPSSEVIQDH